MNGITGWAEKRFNSVEKIPDHITAASFLIRVCFCMEQGTYNPYTCLSNCGSSWVC